MGACFHIDTVTCENCRAAMARTHVFAPGQAIGLWPGTYEQLRNIYSQVNYVRPKHCVDRPYKVPVMIDEYKDITKEQWDWMANRKRPA
jgi:hypothetical protein